jgi:hypothetical protein
MPYSAIGVDSDPVASLVVFRIWSVIAVLIINPYLRIGTSRPSRKMQA